MSYFNTNNNPIEYSKDEWQRTESGREQQREQQHVAPSQAFLSMPSEELLRLESPQPQHYASLSQAFLSMPNEEVAPSPASSQAPSQAFLSRFHVEMPQVISSLVSSGDSRELPHSYKPSEYDVVSGRGKGFYKMPGNQKFREVVRRHAPQYMATKSKLDKSALLNKIVDTVKSQDDGKARFIRKTKAGLYVEISEDEAREKACHAMRDAVIELDGDNGKKQPAQPVGSQAVVHEANGDIHKDEGISSKDSWKSLAEATFGPF